jgi:hypothetical protein
MGHRPACLALMPERWWAGEHRFHRFQPFEKKNFLLNLSVKTWRMEVKELKAERSERERLKVQ